MVFVGRTYGKQVEALCGEIRKTESLRSCVVLEDHGFLPAEIESPFQYYMRRQSSGKKPLYADLLPTEDLWEIRMFFDHAEILDGNNLKAKIEYCEPVAPYCVKRVLWLDQEGNPSKIDNYDWWGELFSSEFLLEDGTTELEVYYHSENVPAVYAQPKFGLYSICSDGTDVGIGLDIKQFLKQYLGERFDADETFITDDYELFLILADLCLKKVTLLVPEKLEQADDLQKMDAHDNAEIAFMHSSEAEYWKSRLPIKCRKWIRRETEFPEASNSREIFILTNSDQVERLEQLVQELPEYYFHVGAITAMSPKLLNLASYSNIELYPGIPSWKREELFQRCAIYLDINCYSEICDAVYHAYQSNLLILGFEHTLHNHDYVLSQCVFSLQQYEAMVALLHRLAQEKDLLKWMTEQQQKMPIAVNVRE